MQRISIMTLCLFSCTTSKDLDSATIENPSTTCSDGNHALSLYVWSSRPEESAFVDDDPFCMGEFDLDIASDGISGNGMCSFERGGEARELIYDLSGTRQNENDYTGEIIMTRGNGSTESSTFSGSCKHEEETRIIHFDWYMVFDTPGGEREHYGVLENQTD